MMVLNYFDCRGRAQPIRNFLRERQIDFVDNRVSVTDAFQEWSLKSQDKAVSGELGVLPTFKKPGSDDVFSEALVIAWELSPESTSKERMLMSSTYQDVLLNVGMLIWCDIAFPGADMKATSANMYSRICQRFERYESLDVIFERSEKYSMAQHFLGESIDAAHYVFGEAFLYFLKERSKLAAFHDGYRSRVANFPRPEQFTGRPLEADTVAQLRKLSR